MSITIMSRKKDGRKVAWTDGEKVYIESGSFKKLKAYFLDHGFKYFVIL